MLEDPEMIPTLEQLAGIQEEKPFECVGSRNEVNTAVCLAIARREKAEEALPLLFTYYKNTSPLQNVCPAGRYLQQLLGWRASAAGGI